MIDVAFTRSILRWEAPPVSRFWFGSPCRFIRWVDILVHVLFPQVIAGRLPMLSCYLMETSPRWGQSWRGWGTS